MNRDSNNPLRDRRIALAQSDRGSKRQRIRSNFNRQGAERQLPYFHDPKCHVCGDRGLIKSAIVRGYLDPEYDPRFEPPFRCENPGCNAMRLSSQELISRGVDPTRSPGDRYPIDALDRIGYSSRQVQESCLQIDELEQFRAYILELKQLRGFIEFEVRDDKFDPLYRSARCDRETTGSALASWINNEEATRLLGNIAEYADYAIAENFVPQRETCNVLRSLVHQIRRQYDGGAILASSGPI